MDSIPLSVDKGFLFFMPTGVACLSAGWIT